MSEEIFDFKDTELTRSLQKFYLEFVNDYLTVEKMAEHKGISESLCKEIVDNGKKYHEMYFLIKDNPKIKSVQGCYVKCRRWLDKVNGNTYHDATIQYRVGKTDFIDAQYGYGEQCYETVKEHWLKVGLLDKRYENVPVWKIFKEFNVEKNIEDVKRATKLNNW